MSDSENSNNGHDAHQEANGSNGRLNGFKSWPRGNGTIPNPHDIPPPVDILHDPWWERQPGETRNAYAAFIQYRDMPKPRSIDGIYRATREQHSGGHGDARIRASGRFRGWSLTWRWIDRADAWDRHLDQEARRIQEESNRAAAERLAARRAQAIESELTLADRLIERATQMLAFPIMEQTIELGQDEQGRRVVQHVKPTRWRIADAAQMVKTAAELRRLALEMETGRTSVRVDIEGEIREMARQFGFDEDEAVALALEMAQREAS